MQIKAFFIMAIITSAFCNIYSANDTEYKYLLSTTPYSLRGLNDICSAEPVGEGRLTFSLSGEWYKQDKAFAYTPNKGTDVVTGAFSFSFGINRFFDLYSSLSGYGLNNYSGSQDNYGIGTFAAGLEARLPFPVTCPVFLGTRVSILGGTSSYQINTNAADGYNYFDTRTGYDFECLLLQTFRIGKEGKCLKFHLNEGGVMTLEESKDNLLLLGAGLEYNPHPLISIGVEGNSRTSLSNVKMREDPLWISPMIQIHTPVNMNFTFGGNISLSDDRSNSTRALEPYQLYGTMAFSFDMLASRKRAQKEKDALAQAQHEQEIQTVEKKNKQLQAAADSLAFKAHSDSLMLAQLRESERLRADSIALKAEQDSILLKDMQGKLEEEKSKRTDAEKQLLSTGLLLLDAVYFETGKSEISINSEPYLMIISKMLLKYPKLQIEVAGHTDNIGNPTKNMNLSLSRADAVRAYLIQMSPQLDGRLTAHGYGSSRPKANNISAEGRKINRRVELQVLNKEVLSEYNK